MYLSVLSSNEKYNMDLYHQNPLEFVTFVIEGLHTSQFPSVVVRLILRWSTPFLLHNFKIQR